MIKSQQNILHDYFVSKSHISYLRIKLENNLYENLFEKIPAISHKNWQLVWPTWSSFCCDSKASHILVIAHTFRCFILFDKASAVLTGFKECLHPYHPHPPETKIENNIVVINLQIPNTPRYESWVYTWKKHFVLTICVCYGNLINTLGQLGYSI